MDTTLLDLEFRAAPLEVYKFRQAFWNPTLSCSTSLTVTRLAFTGTHGDRLCVIEREMVVSKCSVARAGVRATLVFVLLGLVSVSKAGYISAELVIHRSRFSEVNDEWRLEVVACTPHGTTVTFIIRELGQVRSERSTLTPGESASFEIAQGNMNDWTCIAKFELLNTTTRYLKEFPLWGPHGPKCSSCRWIFKDYQSGIFLDSHDGRGPVHVLDWDVDVDTDKQFSSEGD